MALIPAPKEAGTFVVVVIHQARRNTGVGSETVGARALQAVVLAVAGRTFMGAYTAM